MSYATTGINNFLKNILKKKSVIKSHSVVVKNSSLKHGKLKKNASV